MSVSLPNPELPRFYTVGGLNKLAAVYDQLHDVRVAEFDTYSDATAEANKRNDEMLTGDDRLRFVALPDRSVMLGQRCCCVASSHTMAKRIAAALNEHKPNRRGV